LVAAKIMLIFRLFDAERRLNAMCAASLAVEPNITPFGVAIFLFERQRFHSACPEV